MEKQGGRVGGRLLVVAGFDADGEKRAIPNVGNGQPRREGNGGRRVVANGKSPALSHLKSVAAALRPGGLFFFGLHLLPHDADERCIERWRAKTGGTSVCFTLKVTEWDRRKRIETLRVSMLIRKPTQKPLRVQTEMQLRTYRFNQFQTLLAKVPELELAETFDFWYEIDEPVPVSRDSSDTLLVLRKRG